MKFIYPSSVTEVSFSFDYRGDLVTRSMYSKATTYKGKEMIFGFTCDPRYGVYNPSPCCDIDRYVHSGNSPFIYVAPEVSLSRDSLRNSGYKIVRNKEKAVYIIVPDINIIFEFPFHFAIINSNNDVYLYRHRDQDEFTCDNAAELVDRFFKKRFGDVDKSPYTFIYNESLAIQNVYSVQPCSEYENMWSNESYGIKYCFENNVRLHPSIEITPETFAVWKKCSEDNIIVSAVLQSDWQTYPFTIATFLREQFPYIHTESNKAFQNVLRSIGYYDLRNRNTSSMVVSPEDWNMLQKCQLYSLGLSENGGFVSSDVGIPSTLAHKTCIKPTYINEPATFDSLKKMVNM